MLWEALLNGCCRRLPLLNPILFRLFTSGLFFFFFFGHWASPEEVAKGWILAEHTKESSSFQKWNALTQKTVCPHSHEALPGPLQESSLPRAGTDVYSLKMTFEYLLGARPFLCEHDHHLFMLLVCAYVHTCVDARHQACVSLLRSRSPCF